MSRPEVTAGELDEVAATIAALQAAVRERAGYRTAGEVPPLGAPSPLTEAADLAQVSTHFPVQGDTPVIGQALGLTRRAMRLALRWYINPIVEQQNAFNDAVVRALGALEARQLELEHRLSSSDDRPGPSST